MCFDFKIIVIFIQKTLLSNSSTKTKIFWHFWSGRWEVDHDHHQQKIMTIWLVDFSFFPPTTTPSLHTHTHTQCSPQSTTSTLGSLSPLSLSLSRIDTYFFVGVYLLITTLELWHRRRVGWMKSDDAEVVYVCMCVCVSCGVWGVRIFYTECVVRAECCSGEIRHT